MWRTRRLRKLLRLSSSERGLLVKALFLVAAIRVGLWLLPLQVVRRQLARLAQAPARSSLDDLSCLHEIAWAVRVVSRYVPRATCLTQALAAQVLVERAGLPSRLRLGVALDRGGSFRAHAWLESEGRIVVGGPAVEQYTPLLPPGGSGDDPHPLALLGTRARPSQSHEVARS
jgi:hypothetical protein